MAVPKRKVSSARQNKRRSNVWKLDAPALMKCPKCGSTRRLTECATTAVLQRQRSHQEGSLILISEG